MDDLETIRLRHQGRTWHEDGSMTGPDRCDACALLLALDRERDRAEMWHRAWMETADA